MRIGMTLIAAGLASAITPAVADTWDGAYGGTIVSTYADGRVVDVFVNADHSYSITKADGTPILKGTWADANGQSCFSQTDPPAPNGKPVCFPVKEYHVGDTLSGADPSGSFTSVIKAGR